MTLQNRLQIIEVGERFRIRFTLTPPRLLILSFSIIIIIGANLLKLPVATHGKALSWIDAFFTATSATCVTGLIVVDTGAKFTHFGQIVILMLIQIGGLGIMTFSTLFVYLIAGRISITGREIVQETLSQQPMGDLLHLLKSVFLVTIFIEFCGWILLTLALLKDFSPSKAMYYGAFHVISAFCNAGFSLFSTSFINYRGDILINLILITLIILGGLGFIVLYDLLQNRKHLIKLDVSKLSFHSRLVLRMSAILIVSGALLFLILEHTHVLKNETWLTRILTALFQSVTARTAGFNTVDIASLYNATLFFLIMLMFIGASPGSCGGGIKTSTFAVLMAYVYAKFHMREDVNIGYRRIPNAIVSRAIAIAFFSSIIIIIFTMLLLIVELHNFPLQESRRSFLNIIFEIVSAFGTVGLSTGITSQLSPLGRVLITLLMFIGRLGPLTVALAMKGREPIVKFRYVQENVLVG